MRKKFFSAVIPAVLLVTASVGITVSAEETATENRETTTVTEMTGNTEKPEETIIIDTSETAENSTETTTVEKTTVDYFTDDYYNTAGNATLIKEESIIYNSEEMQFIAVTTKDGHVFYVLINYSAESGEDAVYFLNNVSNANGHPKLFE